MLELEEHSLPLPLPLDYSAQFGLLRSLIPMRFKTDISVHIEVGQKRRASMKQLTQLIVILRA